LLEGIKQCETAPSNGPYSKLHDSLRAMHTAVVSEHERASHMLPKKVGQEEEGRNKKSGEQKEGAMFARNVGRAETRKERDCEALAVLEKMSNMLGRRVWKAKARLVELRLPTHPEIGQSLQRAIANLEHQEQHVVGVEGAMRVQCTNAMSLAGGQSRSGGCCCNARRSSCAVGGGESNEQCVVVEWYRGLRDRVRVTVCREVTQEGSPPRFG